MVNCKWLNRKFFYPSKQYPIPSLVTTFLPYTPIFLRILVMFTSMVRFRTKDSSCQIRASNSSLVKALFLFSINNFRISNSFFVNQISTPSRITCLLVRFKWSASYDITFIVDNFFVFILLMMACIRASNSLTEKGFVI